jgi:hypothetical protein
VIYVTKRPADCVAYPTTINSCIGEYEKVASIESLGNLLGFGISGLGLALAILAYRLLAAEQKQPKLRIKMLTSIYVYMVFALTLVGTGVFYELERPREAAVDVTNGSLATSPGKAEASNNVLGKISHWFHGNSSTAKR